MINKLFNRIFKFNLKEWDIVWLPPLTFFSVTYLIEQSRINIFDEVFPIIDENGNKIYKDDRMDTYYPIYKPLYEHTILRRKLNSYWFRIKLFIRRRFK